GQDLLWRTDRFFLVATLLYLAALACYLVPWPAWTSVSRGFVAPLAGEAPPPGDLDWLLLAAFAAYSGAGGVVNASLTHWLRDKGFGMASLGRGAPIQIAGHHLHLVSEGAQAEPSPENLDKWRQWWRFLGLHLGVLWVLGPLAAMALPVLLTAWLLPRRAHTPGRAPPVVLARGLLEAGDLWLWFPTLIAGFWIFFSTQRGVAEGFSRSVTEVLWAGNDRGGSWAGERAPRLYHGVLTIFTAAGAPAPPLRGPPRPLLVRPHRGARGV